MKATLIKIHWFLSSQLGLDPLRFLLAIRGLPYFFRTWVNFKKKYSGEIFLMPCLYDRFQEGGTTKSEYFWQDLLVARQVHAASPKRHVDIGSRVDGFVAHLASFREVEVFDIRPITTAVPGVVFRKANLMDQRSIDSYVEMSQGYCDSLSCLHALEHFGLGRYGDPVDPEGYLRGISNMSSLIKQGGTFYLSVPIGEERVEFNAHRIFDPRDLIKHCRNFKLNFQSLTVINSDSGIYEFNHNSDSLEDSINAYAKEKYALGIFVFKKL